MRQSPLVFNVNPVVRDVQAGAGHPDRQRPFDAFWGARYPIVDDPDGMASAL